MSEKTYRHNSVPPQDEKLAVLQLWRKGNSDDTRLRSLEGITFSKDNMTIERIEEFMETLADDMSPTFAGLTLSGLTASRLMASNASNGLVSVGNLASWITGTSNRVTVTDDTDGTITLSGPQDLHTGATPTFAGVYTTGAIETDNGLVIAKDSVNLGVFARYSLIIGSGTDYTPTFFSEGGYGFYFCVNGTGATKAMVLSSAGHFGVGVDSPPQRLSVYNTDSNTWAKINTAGTGDASGIICSYGGTDKWYLYNSHTLSDDFILGSEGGGNVIRATQAGLVGIGATISPRAHLQIYDYVSISQPTVADVAFANNLYYDGAWKYLNTNKASMFYLYDGYASIFTAPSGTEDTTATVTERFRVHNDGDASLSGDFIIGEVGTDPSTRLHIKAAPAGDTPWIGQILIEPVEDDSEAGISLKTTHTGTDRVWTILAGSGAGNTNLRFYDSTAGADRIVIDDGGYVGIGRDPTNYKVDIYGDSGSQAQLSVYNDGDNANRYCIRCQGGKDSPTGTGTEVTWVLLYDGDATIQGAIELVNGVATITDISDIATKFDIEDTAPLLDKISAIPIKDYSRVGGGAKSTGIVAQDLELIYPDLVSERDGVKMIAPMLLIPKLVKAIQELKAEIDLLKKGM